MSYAQTDYSSVSASEQDFYAALAAEPMPPAMIRLSANRWLVDGKILAYYVALNLFKSLQRRALAAKFLTRYASFSVRFEGVLCAKY